jgi:hypothetical protein
VGDRTRTGDNQIHSLKNTRRKGKSSKPLAESPSEPLAQTLARQSQEYAANGPSTSPAAKPLDPDLARLVEAWPALPEAIRWAMLALVASA